MSLTGLAPSQLALVIERLQAQRPQRGRPRALPLDRRVAIGCTSLRTNLTIRELAAVHAISRSMAHRIVVDITARLAESLRSTVDLDQRRAWIVDGTLVPTRDHRHAAKAKTYRYSCNAQILVRRSDLHVLAVVAGGPGNRNDPVHDRGSEIERRCKHIVACSPMVVIRVCPSSSRPCSVGDVSYAMRRGAAIAGGVHASSMPSLA